MARIVYFGELLPKPSWDDDKWGYVNSAGVFVIKPQFAEVMRFSEGLAAVKKDDNWGYIDMNGVFIINPLNTH